MGSRHTKTHNYLLEPGRTWNETRGCYNRQAPPGPPQKLCSRASHAATCPSSCTARPTASGACTWNKQGKGAHKHARDTAKSLRLHLGQAGQRCASACKRHSEVTEVAPGTSRAKVRISMQKEEQSH
eukprot:1154430-Pelagomonas_calceolata.AAC.5